MLRNVFHYGTWYTNDPDEQDKIKAVNYILIPSLPLVLVLAIVNIYNHKYILAGTNFMVLLLGTITICINPFKKLDPLKLWINFFLTVTCTIQAICYHNGSEYFHIQNLVIVLIFFSERKFLLPSVLYCALAFVITKYIIYHYPPLIEAITIDRAVFNIAWSLSITVFGLVYFKRNQQKHKLDLQEKNTQLAFANNTKEKLFSIIAHDLRSPIAQLKGALNLLSHDYISKEEFQQLTTNFNKQVDQLENNLDNLLSWSQSQLAGIHPKPTIFSVKEALDDTMNLLKENLARKQIEVAIDIRSTLVYIDPDHLQLVFRNLLSNAIKFSNRNGTIYISDQIYESNLFISIRDEGIGISEAKLASLFSDTPIVSERGTEQEKGNGLGLNMCKEFLQLNGASIRATSAKEQGSTFTISLPIAQ